MVSNDVISSAKNAIESMYTGKCTVYAVNTITDEITKRSRSETIALFSSVPCYSSFRATSVTEEFGGMRVIQTTTLFIAPEYEIPEGAKIIVTQNGRTDTYIRSGVPAVYPTHQEIAMERAEEWA